MSGGGCDGSSAVQHEVYFVGYVYDGAAGKRLAAADLTSISLTYRDKTIATTIATDGRFVTKEPLPTWQDYSVHVEAPGYRPFVSTNLGIDVPKSLQMTDGVSRTSTVQTFDVAVRLFPEALKAPKVTITIEKSDALVTTPAPARASGTLRLTPTSASLIEQGLQSANAVWTNDEDLLTKTVSKSFTEGAAEIAEGELLYGVTYQVAIFDVAGYQPFSGANGGTSSSSLLSAGSVTSLLITLQPDAKAALRILGTNASNCTPPLPGTNAYGAAIDVTFSEEIEPAGATFAEDIDNGLSVTFTSSTSPTCALNLSADTTKQERGTRATIAGRVLTLAFNPALGFATMTTAGTACVAPVALTSVVYSLGNVLVQPKGDPARKANLGTLLSQSGTGGSTSTTSLSCPFRATSSF